MTERLILVDEDDRVIGSAEKLEVHRTGALHRAFSVFLFRADGRLLLQRRAAGKYHSALLWSNSCCGHPRPGEDTRAAAERRLEEEFGISVTLRYAFTFTYQADLGTLCEHEVDHVFTARGDVDPHPVSSEIDEWRWARVDDVLRDMEREPGGYTAWFPMAMRELDARGFARAGPLRVDLAT